MSWACFTTGVKNKYEIEVFLLNDVKTSVREPKPGIRELKPEGFFKHSSLTKKAVKEISSQSITLETVKDNSELPSDLSSSEVLSSWKGQSEQKGDTLKAGESGGNSIIDTEFGSVNGPRFLHREIPVYPQIARRLGKEGKVILRLTINENGEVVNIEVIEFAPYGFTESAVDAVKKSKFSPAMKDGRPVACRAILPIRFILKN